MARYILFFFLNTITIVSFGQEEILTGKILADSLDGFAINIVNYTQELGTTNDENGYFKIPAKPGDSIVFSSVQYKSVTKVITPGDIGNSNYQIRLEPMVTTLDKVNVSNVKLSGDILKDAGNIEIVPLVTNQSLGLPFKDIEQPTVEERRIYTATSTALDLLINVLSGRLKKLKQLKKLEELEEMLSRAKNAFSTSFFVKDLGIPEIYISDFMYYCSHDANFENLLSNSKKLLLLEFLQQKAISYKRHKNLTP